MEKKSDRLTQVFWRRSIESFGSMW